MNNEEITLAMKCRRLEGPYLPSVWSIGRVTQWKSEFGKVNARTLRSWDE